MTYYNVLAPLGDSVLNGRVARLNGVLASAYAAADVPVADVAGRSTTTIPCSSAQLVCAWTWVCTVGDATSTPQATASSPASS